MKDNNSSRSIGFTTLLVIAFIVLKLCKVIDWSWWWVLSPIWIPFALLLVVYALIILFFKTLW